MNTVDARGSTPVRAVCFDLDGTLYDQRALQIRMAILIFRTWLAGGISWRDVSLLSSYRKNREHCRTLGAVGDLDKLVLSLTAEGHAVTVGRVATLVQRWINQEPLRLLAAMRDRELLPLMNRLRRRGYKLAVFSDYPVEDKLHALGVPLDLFEALVEAGSPEVSALKPHPKGFLEVCRLLALSPASVLYVGDRGRVDGVGALGAGMRFVLFSRGNVLPKKWRVIRNLVDLELALTGTK